MKHLLFLLAISSTALMACSESEQDKAQAPVAEQATASVQHAEKSTETAGENLKDAAVEKVEATKEAIAEKTEALKEAASDAADKVKSLNAENLEQQAQEKNAEAIEGLKAKY